MGSSSPTLNNSGVFSVQIWRFLIPNLMLGLRDAALVRLLNCYVSCAGRLQYNGPPFSRRQEQLCNTAQPLANTRAQPMLPLTHTLLLRCVVERLPPRVTCSPVSNSHCVCVCFSGLPVTQHCLDCSWFETRFPHGVHIDFGRPLVLLSRSYMRCSWVFLWCTTCNVPVTVIASGHCASVSALSPIVCVPA